MRSLLLSVWNTWKKIAHIIVGVQSRMLLTLYYFILLLPFGILFTFFKDELGIKKKRISQWRKTKENPSSISEIQKQYTLHT